MKYGEKLAIKKRDLLEATLGAAGPFVFADVLSNMSKIWWDAASHSLLQHAIELAEAQNEHMSATRNLLSAVLVYLENICDKPRVINPFSRWLLDGNQGTEQQQIKGSWSFEDLPGDWG